MSMYQRLTLSLLITFATLVSAQLAQAQHLVLFETFTNECHPIITGIDTRGQFEQDVASTVSTRQSKVILFNHHSGNVCDIADYPPSGDLANKLWAGGANQILWAAVDRAKYTGGQRHSIVRSDWSTQIDAEAAKPPVADLSLADMKIDTISLWPDYIVQTDVVVKLNQTITDSIVLHFAVLQNNFPDHYNTPDDQPTNVTVNDVVRYMSTADTGAYAVFTPGSTSGTTKHVVTRIVLPGASSTKYAVQWDYKTNRLIGYLEENPKGNFHIVNAAVLKTGMTGLPSPDPSLEISESLNGQVFDAGGSGSFQWSGLMAPSIDIYLSTDNGTTWTVIDTSGTSATDYPWSVAYWDVPNVQTTQAKIKIVNRSNQMTAIESGTFTIQPATYVSWVRPSPNFMDSVATNAPFTLKWLKAGVDAVNLRYSVHTSGTVDWKIIKMNYTDTSLQWFAPDTVAFLDLQIIPSQNEAPSQITQLKVYRRVQNGAKYSGLARDFAIRSIYPNPVSGAKNVTIDFTSEKPKMLRADVIDLLGNGVLSQSVMSVPEGQISLPTSQLAPGVYFLRLSDGEEAITKRIEIIK